MSAKRNQLMLPLWVMSVPHLLDAIVTLIRHGVDHRKLYALIIKRKLGRKRKAPSVRVKGKVGRPTTRTEYDHRWLWSKYQKGAKLLRERGERVSYFAALEAICIEEGCTPRRARELATQWYKRLSDAKKIIQKST